MPFQISCGACGACRRGLTSSCESVPWLSCYGLGAMAGSWGGVVADLVTVPYADAMLVRLPEGVSIADAAAVGCNIVDAYRCIGPQLTVDASMDVDLLGQALHATAPGGECTASTMYLAPTTPLPLMAMFERCITFRTGQPHGVQRHHRQDRHHPRALTHDPGEQPHDGESAGAADVGVRRLGPSPARWRRRPRGGARAR